MSPEAFRAALDARLERLAEQLAGALDVRLGLLEADDADPAFLDVARSEGEAFNADAMRRARAWLCAVAMGDDPASAAEALGLRTAATHPLAHAVPAGRA
jgi:hypothetical protein